MTTPTSTRPVISRPPSAQSQYTSSSQPVKSALKKQSSFTTSSSQPVASTSTLTMANGPSFSKLPPANSQSKMSNQYATTSSAAGSSKMAYSMAPPTHVPSSGKQPSQMMQSHMQSRVQNQLMAAKEKEKEEANIASENIELPDINSEYVHPRYLRRMYSLFLCF